MRNFIRVTQHGYRRSEEQSTRMGKQCLARYEVFFDNEDPTQVAKALADAKAFRDSLPCSALGSHMRGPARLCAYYPVPGHSEVRLMGAVEDREPGWTLPPICHHTRALRLVEDRAAE